MKKEDLIYKFFNKNLSKEELKQFKEQYHSDFAFQKEIKMQARMLTSLKSAAKLKTGLNGTGKNNISIYLLSSILVIVTSLSIFLLVQNRKQTSEEAIIDKTATNETLHIDSSIHFANNFKNDQGIQEEDVFTSETNDSEYDDEDVSKEQVMIAEKANLDKLDYNNYNMLPAKSDLKLPKTIEPCKLKFELVTDKGTRIEYYPKSFHPITSEKLYFRLKEFYSPEDIISSELLNISAEKGYLGISKILFISIYDHVGNDNISFEQAACENKILIKIPLEKKYEKLKIFELLNDAQNSTLSDAPFYTFASDSLFYSFHIKEQGGYNLGKFIKKRRGDYQLQVGKLLWKPHIKSIYMKIDGDSLLYTALPQDENTYSFPRLAKPDKCEIIIKMQIDDENKTFRIRLNSLKKKDPFTWQLSRDYFKDKNNSVIFPHSF